MPKYFISTSQETLRGISAIKATQLGCGGSGEVTSFWWGVIAHPSNDEYALVIPDEECALASAVYDEEGVLVTPAETVKTLYVNPPNNPTVIITTNDLVDHATLESDGWFSVEEDL
jgi:hypothetical protein